MKKIVFLLCTILLVPNYVSADTVYATEEFTCNGNTINVETEYNRDTYERGLTITKIGENPFQTELYKEDTAYFANDVYCDNNYYVLYGYFTDYNYPTIYDSFILFMDSNGERLQYIESDYGDLEETIGIYYFDQTFVAMVRQTFDEGTYVFVKQVLEFYTLEFELIGTIEDTEEIKEIDVLNNKLLINHQYDEEYDIAYDSNLNTHLPGMILEVEAEYIGESNVDFINSAYLNGSKVENGVYIDYPGEYTLSYYDQVYTFTVHPVIEGVEMNGKYLSDVMIEYNNGNGYLNNEVYNSGEVISKPGNYTFTLKGINDYELSIDFQVLANVEGVINGHTYEEYVMINFTGEGYLNNKYMQSPIEIEKNGDYILNIKGDNGYLETYEFSVVEREKDVNISGFIQNIDIFLVVIVVVSGVIYLKKK